jgi:hypothetical protein
LTQKRQSATGRALERFQMLDAMEAEDEVRDSQSSSLRSLRFLREERINVLTGKI